MCRWGWWYLIGYCHLRQGLRTFRVDQIADIILSDRLFEIPVSFDLRAYLALEPEAQPQVTARMRFAPETAQIAVANRASWESIEENPDGSVVAVFKAPTLEWAASTVLAYGPLVEVVDPPELREMVRSWAQEVAEKYGEGGAEMMGLQPLQEDKNG